VGGAENDPQPELVAQLAQEMYSNDMLQSMVSTMWRFEFEVSMAGAQWRI
jgi:calcium binding protein 39